jgi:hypothetical protein
MEKPTPEEKHLLTSQTIDDNGPGTILRDFETLLDFIGSEGIAVSKTNHLLPMKALEQLNARLARPIELGLKRPLQRSYPHISALYLLLRATGLGRVEGAGNKPRVVLDDEVLVSWRQLNPTERFCTLLETWLLRVDLKILGERGFHSRRPMGEWRNFFQKIPAQGLRIAGDRHEETMIPYTPGLVNLAMFELFALVTVQHGKPQAGQGWCINRVQRTPWGEALLRVLAEHLLSFEFLVRYDSSDEDDFGELQDILQPFFPAWQHNLELAADEFHDGVYIFKVSLGRIWRRIAIPGQATVDTLSDAILEAYAFDHDHLYAFYYKNRFGRKSSIHHPYMDEPPFTPEVRIGELPLRPGVTMTYVYDFGDHWEFDVNLERIDPADRRMRTYRILEAHGESPEQYPSWDDDEG